MTYLGKVDATLVCRLTPNKVGDYSTNPPILSASSLVNLDGL